MPYRSITEEEVPVVAEIQARSFRSDPANYIESYTTGWRVGWRELRLLEDDSRAVAAATLFFRRVSLLGGELEAGLVASVAVPPEERRRGYGRRLIQGLLEDLYARRTPVSLLFPFSVAWYRSLGYGMANLSWYVDLPLHLLPDFPERLHVRRAVAGDEPALVSCRERARLDPANNGWLARTAAEWSKRANKPEYERALLEIDGQVEGYLIYTLSWAKLEVVEWVAASERAWRGLLAFIGAQGEQAKRLRANLPQGSPLLWTLREPYDRADTPVDFVFCRAAELVNGFMLRVVHLPAALTQRRYPPGVSADLVLHVEDRQLSGNGEPLRLVVENGAGVVEPAASASVALHTDMATFSQLYAGVMSAQQARLAGVLQGDDAACRALTALFSCAPWHMWSPDWF